MKFGSATLPAAGLRQGAASASAPHRWRPASGPAAGLPGCPQRDRRPHTTAANLSPFVFIIDLWVLLYARVRHANGLTRLNILIAQTQLLAPHSGNNSQHDGVPIVHGECLFGTDLLSSSLLRLGSTARRISDRASEYSRSPQKERHSVQVSARPHPLHFATILRP